MLARNPMNAPVQLRRNISVPLAGQVAVQDKVQRREKSQWKALYRAYKFSITCMMGILLCIGICFAMNSWNTEKGYQVVHTQSELKQLKAENNLLKVDVAQLKSPNRVQMIAEKDLQMQLPDSYIYSSDKAAVIQETKTSKR